MIPKALLLNSEHVPNLKKQIVPFETEIETHDLEGCGKKRKRETHDLICRSGELFIAFDTSRVDSLFVFLLWFQYVSLGNFNKGLFIWSVFYTLKYKMFYVFIIYKWFYLIDNT